MERGGRSSMERLQPEVPRPKSHSEESLALQEATARAGETGAFVYFRRNPYGIVEETEVQAGGQTGEFTVIALEGDQVDVGQHPECELVIDWDPAVARSHAQIKKAGADWYVDNLDRTNGTLVNGVRVDRVEEHFLSDGDRIRVGDTVIVFHQPGLAPAEPPAPPYEPEEPPPPLTERQKEVLVALVRPVAGEDLLVAPAGNVEIAEEVMIDEDTVKGHLRNLYKAFGLADLPDGEKRRTLVWKALELGAVTDADLSSR